MGKLLKFSGVKVKCPFHLYLEKHIANISTGITNVNCWVQTWKFIHGLQKKYGAESSANS